MTNLYERHMVLLLCLFMCTYLYVPTYMWSHLEAHLPKVVFNTSSSAASLCTQNPRASLVVKHLEQQRKFFLNLVQFVMTSTVYMWYYASPLIALNKWESRSLLWQGIFLFCTWVVHMLMKRIVSFGILAHPGQYIWYNLDWGTLRALIPAKFDTFWTACRLRPLKYCLV